jgi:acetoin utilization deacetylase AcuC-like enzyme
VLYDAGVDSHVDDELGRLSLTNGGLLRRDLQVTRMSVNCTYSNLVWYIQKRKSLIVGVGNC